MIDVFERTFLGACEIPHERAHDIGVVRRRRFRKLAPLAAVYGLLSALVLVVAFWRETTMPMVFVWCYASAVLVFMRIRENKRTGDKVETPEEGRAQDKRILRYTLASGGVWAVMIAALMTYAGPEHSMLLGVLTATVLCVGALLHSSFPAASLGYSLLIVSGATLGMFLGHHPMPVQTAILLVGCALALQRFAASNTTNFIRRHLNEAQLAEAKETVSLLLSDFEAHSADWLWRTNREGRLMRGSARFAQAAGLTVDELDGASFFAMFETDDAGRLEALMCERRNFRDQVFRVTVGAREGWWSVSGQPTGDGGYRGVASDITRSRDAEARIAYVTEFDTLTDLPNRAVLVRKLEAAADAMKAGAAGHALFCIDLDNFKTINDTMGHPTGDAFLKVVSQRLRECVGADAFLARLGGDEFAVMAHLDRAQAEEQADLIVDALLAPVQLKGKEILAGGSVGVAIAPEDGADPAELMKNAELALYRAKAQGRGCVRFFEQGMEEDARVRADLESDLRSALANEAMDIYFQPLVNTRTHKVSGYETLLRWNRPGHGLVSPAMFIACAEETGIIVPLGEWVIRKAVEEAAMWKDDVKVAVNLSPAQMKNPSLVATVVGALAASQLDPARLEIEITESVLMHETDQNLRTLHALRELGVRIALDDFGTGYSSLSYLRAFPFDKIKIDQRFVRDIDASPENQAIVRAVISLARDLGMRVTAEGVENEQQAAMLAGLGCTEVQGFLYSRPVPASELEKKPPAERPSARVLQLPSRLRA